MWIEEIILESIKIQSRNQFGFQEMKIITQLKSLIGNEECVIIKGIFERLSSWFVDLDLSRLLPRHATLFNASRTPKTWINSDFHATFPRSLDSIHLMLHSADFCGARSICRVPFSFCNSRDSRFLYVQQRFIVECWTSSKVLSFLL